MLANYFSDQKKIGFWIYSDSYSYVFGKIAVIHSLFADGFEMTTFHYAQGSWLASVKMCISLGMTPLSFDHVEAMSTIKLYANSMVAQFLVRSALLTKKIILKAQIGSRSRIFGRVASDEKTRAPAHFSGALQTAAQNWSAALPSGKRGSQIT
jgi:hypothetical protein